MKTILHSRHAFCWLKSIVMIILIFSVSLLAAEFLLLTVGYEGARERVHFSFDNNYGMVKKDSWVFTENFNPESQRVSLNGVEVRKEKDPDRQRIIFLGDSGTAGARIRRGKAFPRQFGDLLNTETQGRVEIINAGAWGMTTVGEYNALKNKLVQLNPDIVVLGLFMANDINYNLVHIKNGADPIRNSITNTLRAHSALVHFSFLYMMAMSGLDRSLMNVSLVDEEGFAMANYRDGEIATYKKNYSPTMETAFRVLHELFYRFKQLSLEKNFQFVVVLIPTSSTTLDTLDMFMHPDALLTMIRQGKISSEEDLDFQKPTRRVTAICAELTILCIDPTLSFRTFGKDAFVPKDDHLSIDGHRIIVEELQKYFSTQTLTFIQAPRAIPSP